MSKKTFKSEQKKENKEYYQSVKKCHKIKPRLPKNKKEGKKKGECYLPLNKKRFADLQYLKKKYPNEWSEFQNEKGGMGSGSFHQATGLEGSWLHDWNPYKKKRSSKRTKRNNSRGGARHGESKKNSNSAYFEYKSILGSSNKFWRIVKNGSKITTHYGKIGTLGQMTTKDYKSKVDIEYDKLIKSKKKKGYVESMDFGDKKPKPPTKIEREFLKICKKTQDNSKLNPGSRNFDCEGQLDSSKSSDSELKWQIQWNKDALKNGEFDWSKYDEHNKSKRKKKKTQKGGRKLKKIKKRSHNKTKMNNSRGKNKALEKLWTDMSNMKKYVFIMKDGSYQIKSLLPSFKGQRGSDFHNKYCLPMIEKANADDSVKAILTAGNSFDGYIQLYDDVGNSSADQVLKNYKKYWKHKMEGKLYTC